MNSFEQLALDCGDVDYRSARMAMQPAEILSRLSNKPVLMEASHARSLFASLMRPAGIDSLVDANGEQISAEKPRVKAYTGVNGDGDRYRPYRIHDGIALIPINGALYHKWGILGYYSAGYDAVLRWVGMAVEDPEVEGILLDFDSPGGEVAGCFDAARSLRELGQQKPIAAICNELNASAAMCLASAAEHRYITQTGQAGSIGVVMAHWSYQGMLEQDGVEVTLIFSGEHKVEGNRYENLPEEVYNQFKNECHELRQQFATIVSDHTEMSLDDVLATEAALYSGQAAIEVGLADELINGNEVIPAFRDYLSSQDGSTTIGATMSDQGNTPAPEAGSEAPPAGAQEQQQEQPAAETGTTQARTDERARIDAILNHENAEGRASLANHLAFQTEMSVEEAAAVLASGEQTGAGNEGGSSLDDAMAQAGGGGGVGAGDAPDGQSKEAAINTADIYKNWNGKLSA